MSPLAWIAKLKFPGFSRIQRFLLAAGAFITIAMVLLTYTVSDRIAASAVKAAADQTALLIGAFVEPLIQNVDASAPLDGETVAKLDELVVEEFRDRVQILKVWSPDGTLIYNSDKRMVGQRMLAQPPKATLQGEVVGFFDKLGDPENEHEQALKMPLIEIYVPLYKTGTKQLIAVGEFYTNGQRISTELRTLKFVAMGIVGLIMIPMMAALLILVIQANTAIVTHQDKLTRKIAQTERFARENDRLRRVSEEARLEAASSNEKLLEQIGQDLHDGPVQLLSLLVLKLSAPDGKEAAIADQSMQAGDLAIKVLKEVRDISTGLVLPQLEGLTIRETIEEAIRQHTMTTGTDVGCRINNLPAALGSAAKICIFRVVQESLNNAFQHANGADQFVEATADQKFLTVAIKNTGAGNDIHNHAPNSKSNLGLSGIRRRVEALNGTLHVVSDHVAGTTVTAKIPIVPGSMD